MCENLIIISYNLPHIASLILKILKPTFLDVLFDLYFLGVSVAVGFIYGYAGPFLKALAWASFAALTIWSLAAGPHASTEIKKFGIHLLLRMTRILIGGGILLLLSQELIAAHPFTAVGMIAIWLGGSWHSSFRHNAIQAYSRQTRYPVQEKKSTSPGQEFTAADLTPGKKYCVITEFTDYYGNIHTTGECWEFVEKHFLPQEDGLTLHCKKNGQDFWIYLQWREGTQGMVIDNFHCYVQEC